MRHFNTWTQFVAAVLAVSLAKSLAMEAKKEPGRPVSTWNKMEILKITYKTNPIGTLIGHISGHLNLHRHLRQHESNSLELQIVE